MVCLISDYNHPKIIKDENFKKLREKINKLPPLHSISNQKLDILSSIAWHSEFLSRLIMKWPKEVTQVLMGETKDLFITINNELNDIENFNEITLRKKIRTHRLKISLLCALNECFNLIEPNIIWKMMSDAAEISISSVVNWITNDFYKNNILTISDVTKNGFFVLALGKLGARELNFFSDLDLIFIFDENKSKLNIETARKAYIKFAHRFIDIMEKPDSNGIAWKIDLRLRPDPAATSIAISQNAAILYYETMARTWERAAFIRSRVIAGNMNIGNNFLKIISPFIWRKYLDYSVISELFSLLSQLQKYKKNLGRNIKTSECGIREIEFFTQIQQLIAGGRYPEIRTNNTIDALYLLSKNNWISNLTCNELIKSYIFLRQIEHRLQMKNGIQTHSIPSEQGKASIISSFSGFENLNNFNKVLKASDQNVRSHTQKFFEKNIENEEFNFEISNFSPRPETINFGKKFNFNSNKSINTKKIIDKINNNIFGLISNSDSVSLESLNLNLENLGYKNPNSVSKNIIFWMSGNKKFSRNHKSKIFLYKLLTILLPMMSESKDPDAAFINFSSIINNISITTNFFSLLLNKKELFELLIQILTTSNRLANDISKHPDLLDSFIQHSISSKLISRNQYKNEFRKIIQQKPEEIKLESLRKLKREFHFRICLQSFLNLIDSKQAGKAFTNLSGACLETVLEIAILNMSKRYGKPPCEFGLVMFGRFASSQMNASSDLDFVVVYDNEDNSNSISPSYYFASFARTLINFLSSPMSEGKLYETDMRLRPSGLTGPVATSLKSFRDYYKLRAWEWEKIAIRKTSVISLKSDFQSKLYQTIKYIRSLKLKPNKLASEIINMKQTRNLKQFEFSIYETKYVDGGQRDLEFLNTFMKNSKTRDISNGNLNKIQELYDSIDQIISSCFEKPNKEKFTNSFIISLLKFTKFSSIAKLEKNLNNSKNLISKKLNFYLKLYK